MQHASFLFNNHLLHYTSSGQGHCVVLLHGFGEDHRIWQPTAARLSRDYKLIVPDLPGSGESPFNPELYTIDDFADSIKALLDRLGITSCTMIGHSMGGYITLAFAEKYPAMLKGFGLFHSTAFADSEEKKEARKKSIAFIEKNGPGLFLKQSIPNLFAEKFRTEHPEMIEMLVENGNSFTGAALIRYYESMIQRPDRTDLLRKTTQPILFIAGRYDQAVPFEDSLRQSYLPVISYLHVLDLSAHMGMWEQKDEAVTALEKFLHDISVDKE